MKKQELFDLFVTQSENDGSLDGKRWGKVSISADMLVRDSADDPTGDVIAQWWDAGTIAIVREYAHAQAIANACDLAGVTVLWMHA